MKPINFGALDDFLHTQKLKNRALKEMPKLNREILMILFVF